MGKGLRNVVLNESTVDEALNAQPGSYAITFDDGYTDNYIHAWPILQELGLRASIFVCTGFLGSADPFPWWKSHFNDPRPDDLPLTKTQLREMADGGVFTVGSHGVSHRNLTTLTPEVCLQELTDSRTTLEDMLGRRVEGFCYPRGDLERKTVQQVEEAGYKFGVVTPPRFIQHGRNTLIRVGVYSTTTHWRFRVKASRAFQQLQRSRKAWMVRTPLRRLVSFG